MGYVTATQPGQIIFLNGTSSSGKTSIAEDLLRVLDRPYFHLAVDAINSMRAKEKTGELPPDELAAALTRTRAGFHRAAAGMAEAGNDIIVDYVLSEPWRLLDCLTVFAGFDVVFVGVHCPLGELQRREQMRGDREPGQAASQVIAVHEHGIYDLECDTGSATPLQCALQIKDYLGRRTKPTAFDQLRSTLIETECR
jgi:chloramphenicol 3-O phosphotransferase